MTKIWGNLPAQKRIRITEIQEHKFAYISTFIKASRFFHQCVVYFEYQMRIKPLSVMLKVKCLSRQLWGARRYVRYINLNHDDKLYISFFSDILCKHSDRRT